MRSLQNTAEIFRDHAGLSRCTQAHIIALTYVNATNASHEGRGMAVTFRVPSAHQGPAPPVGPQTTSVGLVQG